MNTTLLPAAWTPACSMRRICDRAAELKGVNQ